MWTPEQKLELVKQTFEAGMNVSIVARRAGIATTQLFQWKKVYFQRALWLPSVPTNLLCPRVRQLNRFFG